MSAPSIIIASPVLLLGGTEMHMSMLAKCLLDIGYKVNIVVYHEADPSMIQQFVSFGSTVTELCLPQSQEKAEMFLLLLRLARFFRQEQPDAVHVQYLAPGLIPIMAAWMARVPVILATVHQLNSYGPRAGRLQNFAARFCDTFLSVSKAVENSWFGDSRIFEPEMSLKGRKHWTINNPVELYGECLSTSIQSDIRDLNDVKDIGVRTVGVVGRLRREKGQTVLLEAFTRLQKQRTDLILLVVGDGPDRAFLEEQARQFGIENHVRLIGSLPPNDVWRMYRTMDVVVVPSLAEGFGLVAAEALAAGRPVVTSDVGGLREVIRHEKTGLLVPPGDAGALAAAMARILDDPAYAARLAAAGRADVAERFSVARFNARIGEAYRQLLEAPPSESATP